MIQLEMAGKDLIKTTIKSDPDLWEKFLDSADRIGAAGNNRKRFGKAVEAALFMWSSASEKQRIEWLKAVDAFHRDRRARAGTSTPDDIEGFARELDDARAGTPATRRKSKRSG